MHAACACTHLLALWLFGFHNVDALSAYIMYVPCNVPSLCCIFLKVYCRILFSVWNCINTLPLIIMDITQTRKKLMMLERQKKLDSFKKRVVEGIIKLKLWNLTLEEENSFLNEGRKRWLVCLFVCSLFKAMGLYCSYPLCVGRGAKELLILLFISLVINHPLSQQVVPVEYQ